MAFEEKRRLSQGLGSLAGDKLGVVMEIIAESQHFDSVRLLAVTCMSSKTLATCSCLATLQLGACLSRQL